MATGDNGTMRGEKVQKEWLESGVITVAFSMGIGSSAAFLNSSEDTE